MACEMDTTQELVFEAVMALLALGQTVNAYTIASYTGLTRNAIYYHINKAKQKLNIKG